MFRLGFFFPVSFVPVNHFHAAISFRHPFLVVDVGIYMFYSLRFLGQCPFLAVGNITDRSASLPVVYLIGQCIFLAVNDMLRIALLDIIQPYTFGRIW
jgi:hypothetical protein